MHLVSVIHRSEKLTLIRSRIVFLTVLYVYWSHSHYFVNTAVCLNKGICNCTAANEKDIDLIRIRSVERCVALWYMFTWSLSVTCWATEYFVNKREVVLPFSCWVATNVILIYLFIGCAVVETKTQWWELFIKVSQNFSNLFKTHQCKMSVLLWLHAVLLRVVRGIKANLPKVC